MDQEGHDLGRAENGQEKPLSLAPEVPVYTVAQTRINPRQTDKLPDIFPERLEAVTKPGRERRRWNKTIIRREAAPFVSPARKRWEAESGMIRVRFSGRHEFGNTLVSWWAEAPVHERLKAPLPPRRM